MVLNSSTSPVQALGDCRENGALDERPVEQDLLVVEPQHRESPQSQPGVGLQVPAPVLGSMMLEPIQLGDESFADQGVDGVAVNSDLLPDLEGDTPETGDEHRLQA